MPTLETSLAFFVVSVLLAFAPGPDNLFVMMQSATNGRRAGAFVVLGLCTGLLVHTAAVTLGLAAVFAASALAFSVLKFVGAAYLAFLAVQAYRAPVTAAPEAQASSLGALRLYLRGILMNVTNPKVVLFFLAFLPQFVDPKRGSVSGQIVWFGLLFMLSALLVFGSITLAAGFFGDYLRRKPGVQRILNRASACVFAGLAVRLATSRH